MKNRSLLSGLALILPLIAAVLLSALLGYFAVVPNVEISGGNQGFHHIVIGDFVCLDKDSETAPIGIVREYRFSLDEKINGESCLAFYTVHQFAQVYIDGELVYSLMPSAENKISDTTGCNWNMIQLSDEDLGKEICVQITPVYESIRSRETTFLYGSPLSIYRECLAKDLPQLVLGYLSVFVGCVFICIGLYNRLLKKTSWMVFSLGIFAFILGTWRITDTHFSPFALPQRPLFLFYTSIAMLMIGVIPLLNALKEKYGSFQQKLFNLFSVITAGICIVQVILQFSGILDIRRCLFLTHIVIGVGAIMIIVNYVCSKVKSLKDKKNTAYDFLPLIFVLGVVIDIVMYYINQTSSGLVFTLAMFLIYSIFVGIKTMIGYEKKERQLAQKQRELTEYRIYMMLSQIQPHFIYNTLNTIYYLCGKDTELAKSAISSFSDYLRSNIDTIDQTEPISFDKELLHIKTYLDLERIRFGDELKVEYHIGVSSFNLPMLTVQPLVENAVKHGTSKKRGGGTVTISTSENELYYIITVSDTGVGFDTENYVSDGKKHIGIENVRYRLRDSCNGTLIIESEIGKGTKATVRIPKRGEKP